MTTITKKNDNLLSLFNFDDWERGAQQVFLEEVGTLIFQSALMKFISIESSEIANKFELFLEQHAAADSFMENLSQEFPIFEKILLTEIKNFKEEISFQ